MLIRYYFLVTLCLFTINTVQSALPPKPVLTVYTYNSFNSQWGPGEELKQAFEAQCLCVVAFKSFGDGATLLNRLRLEGSNSKADIVLGLDNNLMAEAKQTNLFRAHQIKTEAILTINWQDEYFIPYDYGYFSFIYNKQRIKSPPESLKALINHENPWKIIYQDPRTSTPGLGLLLWINYLFPDQIEQTWRNLIAKTVTVTKGWSEAYSLFLKGEADFVLSYSTSPAAHKINDNDDRYQAAIFKEGHYRQIELAAILNSSKQPELSHQFLQFILTPNIQRLIASKNYMYPVVNVNMPKAYQQLIPVTKTIEYPSDEIAKHRKTWIKQWQTIVISQ